MDEFTDRALSTPLKEMTSRVKKKVSSQESRWQYVNSGQLSVWCCQSTEINLANIDQDHGTLWYH